MDGEEGVIASPLYGTIWPIQSLTLYEDPGKGTRLASVPGGTALCVLAEEGDWFRVRYGRKLPRLKRPLSVISLESVVPTCAPDSVRAGSFSCFSVVS